MFDELKGCFLNHGVDEAYLESWFSNYKTDSIEQKSALQRVIAAFNANRPMAFLGKYGGGKTHLAQAIVKSHLVYKREAYYYTLSGLFRDYRRSLRDDEFTEQKFFQRVGTAHCLVIDEFNLSSNSEPETRLIQEIIDIRYSARLQTIFVGNIEKAKFKESLTERLADRLRDQQIEVIMFNWDSYRKRNK